MSSDKFSLKWEEFSNNAASSFRALYEDTDFTDVTLASSDGQTIKAHKVVLSSCSPVLKSMLVKTSHARPLMYMRGVTLGQLETILTFCYLGQAEVLHSELGELLEVARDLGIKGLSQEDTQEQDQEHVQKGSKQKNNKSSCKITTQNSKEVASEVGIPIIKTEIMNRRATFTFSEASEEIVDYSNDVVLESTGSYENSSQANELFETNNEEKDNKHGHECTSCGKSYSIKGALNRHVKEKHTREANFSCNECDWTGPRQYLIAAHMKSVHGIIEQNSSV